MHWDMVIWEEHDPINKILISETVFEENALTVHGDFKVKYTLRCSMLMGSKYAMLKQNAS